jgi:hypothetical protein
MKLAAAVPHQNFHYEEYSCPRFLDCRLDSDGEKFAQIREISDGHTPAREEPSKRGLAALDLCREAVTWCSPPRRSKQ